jgi:hypothetical protein
MKRRQLEVPTYHSEFDSIRLEMELELEKISDKLEDIHIAIRSIEEITTSIPLLIALLTNDSGA